jgi:hypothetical protein
MRRKLDVNPAFDTIWRSVRRIVTTKGCGTGCVVRHEAVNPGYMAVVTNAHVVDGFQNVECQATSYGKIFTDEAELVAIDYAHDLAILEVPVPLPDPLGFISHYPHTSGLDIAENPRPGDSVTVCGYPQGCETPRLAQGIVSGFAELPIEGHKVQSLVVQAPVNQGNSGGPVCDEDGALVGVVWAINSRLKPEVPRPGAPTARQAIEYMEQALVPVDGFGYVLDPEDIVRMLDSFRRIRGLGKNMTQWEPASAPMSRSAFVYLQRQIADLRYIPQNTSCIGPFNYDWKKSKLFLGFYESDQIELDTPKEWIDNIKHNLIRNKHWHFYLRGYTIVAYHKGFGYNSGIWVDRVRLLIT